MTIRLDKMTKSIIIYSNTMGTRQINMQKIINNIEIEFSLNGKKVLNFI